MHVSGPHGVACSTCGTDGYVEDHDPVADTAWRFRDRIRLPSAMGSVGRSRHLITVGSGVDELRSSLPASVLGTAGERALRPSNRVPHQGERYVNPVTASVLLSCSRASRSSGFR